MERPKKMYSVDNGTAYWTPEAEEWMWENAEIRDPYNDSERKYTNPGGTGGYRAKMSPRDFLLLTLGLGYENEADKYGFTDKLDKDKFESYDLPMWLDFDYDTGEITGHEGRHRAYSLMKNGVNDMDVRLRPSGKFDKSSPKDINGLRLTQQNMGGYGSTYKVKGAIPMNYDNDPRRKNVADLFGRELK